MLDKVIENNQVNIIGEVVQNLSSAMRFLGKDFILWMCRLTDLVRWWI